MAKSKAKAKVDASVGPSNTENGAGNEAVPESAPSESVEVEMKAATEAANMSEGADMKEAANEVDKKEETADAVDQSEEGDNKKETTDDPDEAQDEEEEDDPDDVQDEVEEDDPDEAQNEEDDEEESEEESGEEEIEEEGGEEDEEETKENGLVEPRTSDVIPEGGKVGEGDKKGEDKGSGKAENAPKAKRMRKKKKVASDGANKPVDTDKAGSAAEKKHSKTADGMGLIFMCNAKTKKDCFQYKVFGLPESKKELVAKVYKGMRLFLFDVDLKLMYGIYRAASPGGYNIEPKAFKSAFPSQVRFNILSDCLPLPEEKFKAAIKGNYYGRNKFNTQLSAEQVKSLCKLFRTTGKLPKNKLARGLVRADLEASSSALGKKRSRADESLVPYARDRKRSQRDDLAPSARDRQSSRRGRGRREQMVPRERERRERTDPRRRERRERDIPRRHRDPYPRREAYGSPLALRPAPPPPPPISYAYDRPVDDYYYRREPVPLEPRPLALPDYRDPYSSYREPVQYREPAAYPPATLPPPAYNAPLYYRY